MYRHIIAISIIHVIVIFIGCPSVGGLPVAERTTLIQAKRYSGTINDCTSTDAVAVQRELALVLRCARHLNALKSWPPKKDYRVCVADAAAIECPPYQGPLAGCATYARAIWIAKRWPGGRWLHTLRHEFLGLLTIDGLIDMQLPEDAMLAHPTYRTIMQAGYDDCR